MATARDIVTDALYLIGVGSAEESVSNADAQVCLRSLNRMLEQWNTERLMIYQIQTESFTLTPGTGSYSIGSGATFNTTRPVDIQGAQVRENGIDYEVHIVESAEYALIDDKATQTNLPELLYYEASHPNGTIYLWPVPNVANAIRIQTRKPFSALTLDTTLAYPPGYEEAVLYNLAIRIAPMFGRPVVTEVQAQAVASKANIKRQNQQVPILRTPFDGFRDYNIYSDA